MRGESQTAPERTVGVLAVVVTLMAGAAPPFASEPLITLAALACLTGAGWWSSRQAEPRLGDATIVVASLWLILAIAPSALWPIPGLVALLLAGWRAGRGGRWCQWREWVRFGRIDPFVWAMWLVIVLVSVIGLLAWNRLFDGELPQAYRDLVHDMHPSAAIAGAFVFLVINGAIEDSIWAGVLLSATERLVPVWIAVVTVATSFGLAHLHGIPNGPVGVVMAGTWGLVLVVLRLRTRGMGATYLAHIIADATIVLMLLPTVLSV